MAQFPKPNILDAPPQELPKLGALEQLEVLVGSNSDLLGGVVFETDTPTATLTTVDFEDLDDCIRTAEKAFEDGVDYSDSFQFSAFHAVKCRTVGSGGMEAWEARVRRGFEARESFYLERALRDKFLELGTDVSIAGYNGPPKEAAALLLAAAPYIAVPRIHTPRGPGPFLATNDFVESIGAELIVGAGYADPATAGIDNLFLTGRVTIRRSEDLVINTVLSAKDNEVYAIAERQYSVTIEDGIFYVYTFFAGPAQ